MSTSRKQKEPSAAEPAEPLRDRILRSAYHCFERFGVNKTTIEDIAEAASVSRPSVYKYFGGKEDIVDHIAQLESLKVNAEVRRKIVRQGTLESTLTEALLLVVRTATKNMYVRRILQDTSYLSKAAVPTSAFNRKHRVWWGNLIEEAMHTHNIAADLTIDEVVSWLTSAEMMLLVKVDGVDINDADLRQFIRRFIVRPLLPQSEAPQARRGKRAAPE